VLIIFVQDNLFEWHFTVRGPPDSDFDGGVYHGRIVLPPEYPMKPPSIILLTVRILGFLECFLAAVKCSVHIPFH
jgi:ubiquitin-protein ligase